MKTTTISNLRANIKEYVDGVIDGGSTLLINRGNTGAILMSLDEYNSLIATCSVLGQQKSIGIDLLERENRIRVNVEDL